MINTVAQGVLGRNRSLSMDRLLRSAEIWVWQRKYKYMRQNKKHIFTIADQDLIGLIIFKYFADEGWIGFNYYGSGLNSD